MNKKELYESIMRKVSQEVKKVLNEAENISLNPYDYVLVDAWNEAYYKLSEHYADALVNTNYGNYFIIPKTDIYEDKFNIFNLYANNYEALAGRYTDEEYHLYRIPQENNYKSLDEVEDDLQNGVLDPQDEDSCYFTLD